MTNTRLFYPIWPSVILLKIMCAHAVEKGSLPLCCPLNRHGAAFWPLARKHAFGCVPESSLVNIYCNDESSSHQVSVVTLLESWSSCNYLDCPIRVIAQKVVLRSGREASFFGIKSVLQNVLKAGQAPQEGRC